MGGTTFQKIKCFFIILFIRDNLKILVLFLVIEYFDFRVLAYKRKTSDQQKKRFLKLIPNQKQKYNY